MADRDRTTLDYVRPGAEDHGRLKLGEFIRYMKNVDEDVTSEECEIGFDSIDTNRDGEIDFDEFVAWWTDRSSS